jgi:hypothetical protein
VTIFVRHGKPQVEPSVDSSEWHLEADALVAVSKLASMLPSMPIVSSEERKARETAMLFGGSVTTDARLGEVRRPWVSGDLRPDVVRYLRGEEIHEWEPQRSATLRFANCVRGRRDAIYVTHGTVLALYLASVVDGLDPVAFWNGLTFPDAWHLEDGVLTRLG